MNGPDLKSYSLGPFGGADPRIIDDRFVEGTRLRGGQNAVMLDGEWWCRGGLQWMQTLPRGFGSSTKIAWRKIISYEDTPEAGTSARTRTFFVSRYGVFAIDPSVGDAVTPWHYDYGSLSSTTVTAVQGSLEVVSAGAIGLNFIWVESSGYAYGCAAGGGGTHFRLDRPWQEASGVYTVKIVPTWLIAYSTGTDVTDATIFRQIADYATGGEVYSAAPGNSPVCRGPATYLVVAFGPSATDDPIAIRVDLDAPVIPVTNFFRDSSSSSAASTKLAIQPRYVRAYKERLIFGAAADTRGKDALVTWWYSAPGDMVTWHTGVRTKGGTPNLVKFTDSRDPITGLEVSSDMLTIHRASSQSVVSFQPSGQFALDERPNRQGFGLQTNDLRSLIVANNVQYLLTEGGPASFDGQQMSYLDPAISDLFVRFRDIGSGTVPLYTGHIGWHAPDQGMLGWILRTENYLPTAGISVPWIVYDYRRNSWMVWTIPTTAGEYAEAAGPQHISTSRGIVWKIPQPVWGGAADDDVEVEPYIPTPTPVLMTCDTPWTDLGEPEQKWLEQVDVILRAPQQPSFSGNLIGVNDPATFHVDVYTDYKEASESGAILRSRRTSSVSSADYPAESGLKIPGRVILRLSPHIQGSVFRFRFSGDPFRLSNVVLWYRSTESREKAS